MSEDVFVILDSTPEARVFIHLNPQTAISDQLHVGVTLWGNPSV